MSRTRPLLPLVTFVLLSSLAFAGCMGGNNGNGGTTPSSSASMSMSATATGNAIGTATTVTIDSAPESAGAGSKATVCFTITGAGHVAHVAIHWDNTSHAAEPARTFQTYDLGVSYPNNRTSADPNGYDLRPTGAHFCTAATMPGAGSIYVVAHVIDSAGAPGKLSSEREIRQGSGSPPVITIQNFAFSPESLTVSPGATVQVKNLDSTKHTVTGTGFDTGDVMPGMTGSFVAPSTPGSYPFTCAYHASMHGTLTVTSS
jgi:plastocyanin